jgi:hypothetical protein
LLPSPYTLWNFYHVSRRSFTIRIINFGNPWRIGRKSTLAFRFFRDSDGKVLAGVGTWGASHSDNSIPGINLKLFSLLNPLRHLDSKDTNILILFHITSGLGFPL